MGYNIRVKDVWFSYIKGEDVLKGINLIAQRGEITAIIGPTASGKSTLLLIMAGLLKPDKGVIYYDDKPLEKLLSYVKKDIGVLFQDPDDHLFNPTVFDEIAFALRSLGMKEDEVRNRVNQIAKMLGIKHLLHKSPFRLSVGEKKKVALASILVYEPKVLFLDEPTANLDSRTISLVKSLIINAKNKGKTVVATSCDLEFVIQVADRVYAIDNGQVKVNCQIEEFLREEIFAKINLHQPLIYKVLKVLGIEAETLLKVIRRGL